MFKFNYKQFNTYVNHTLFLESFQQETVRRQSNSIFLFEKAKYDTCAHTCKLCPTPLLPSSVTAQRFVGLKQRHNPLKYTLTVYII